MSLIIPLVPFPLLLLKLAGEPVRSGDDDDDDNPFRLAPKDVFRDRVEPDGVLLRFTEDTAVGEGVHVRPSASADN